MMYLKLFLLLSFLSGAVNCIAQTNWSLALNGWYDRQSKELDDGTDQVRTLFSGLVDAGYWFNKNVQAGVEYGYELENNKRQILPSGPNVTYYDSEARTWSTGVYVKYYFNINPITPFIGLRPGYSRTYTLLNMDGAVEAADQREESYGFSIPIGAVHKLSKRIGLMATWGGFYYSVSKPIGGEINSRRIGFAGLRMNDDVKLGIVLFLRPVKKEKENF